MYKLHEDHLGVKCNFIAYGDTVDEVVEKIFVHGIEYHPEFYDASTVEKMAELDQLIRTHVESAETYFGEKE